MIRRLPKLFLIQDKELLGELTIKELYEKLDSWKAHNVNHWAASIGRTATINKIQSEIKQRIDIEEMREYLIKTLS